MRTTLNLSADLLAAFKRLAADTHRSLSAVIEEALREALVRRRDTRATRRVGLTIVDGDGPLPGIDLNSNAALKNVLDADTPLDKLR